MISNHTERMAISSRRRKSGHDFLGKEDEMHEKREAVMPLMTFDDEQTTGLRCRARESSRMTLLSLPHQSLPSSHAYVLPDHDMMPAPALLARSCWTSKTTASEPSMPFSPNEQGSIFSPASEALENLLQEDTTGKQGSSTSTKRLREGSSHRNFSLSDAIDVEDFLGDNAFAKLSTVDRSGRRARRTVENEEEDTSSLGSFTKKQKSSSPFRRIERCSELNKKHSSSSSSSFSSI